MSTPQAHRFETLRQEIDSQDITGPMRNGSQIRVELDEEPGGGIDGKNLYTQQLIEFRPISQADGTVAPKDILESWIKGKQQFDFEIRVRPICPSCNTLMGVGDLPDHLMGRCFRCLTDTCPICVTKCVSCDSMMCNQHSLGHGVEGGPFCSSCLQHVIAEEEWQRQLQAYNLALEKLEKDMGHREVMEQIWREDERKRIAELVEYYKHLDELEAETIQQWMSEMVGYRRFQQELEQKDRESWREYDHKMEGLLIEEQKIDKKHQRETRALDIEDAENQRKHAREMRDKDTKDREIDQKHEREMYSNLTERKKMQKKHRREEQKTEYDHEEAVEELRIDETKIGYDHDETMEKHRIDEKQGDQKDSREKSKINKKHSREQKKIDNNHTINKQQENREDRKQKIEEEKTKRLMDLRETLLKEGYQQYPPHRNPGKGKKRKRRRKKNPAVPVEIE